MTQKKVKAPKLHYNKDALVEEYTETYTTSMKVIGLSVAIAVLYFIALIVYLGAFSHEPHKDKYDTFKDRFTIEYDGTKLPYYNE